MPNQTMCCEPTLAILHGYLGLFVRKVPLHVVKAGLQVRVLLHQVLHLFLVILLLVVSLLLKSTERRNNQG